MHNVSCCISHLDACSLWHRDLPDTVEIVGVGLWVTRRKDGPLTRCQQSSTGNCTGWEKRETSHPEETRLREEKDKSPRAQGERRERAQGGSYSITLEPRVPPIPSLWSPGFIHAFLHRIIIYPWGFIHPFIPHLSIIHSTQPPAFLIYLWSVTNKFIQPQTKIN